MSNMLERTRKKIALLKDRNAAQIAAVEAQIKDLAAKSEKSIEKSKEAFEKSDFEAYYKALFDQKRADEESASLNERLEELRRMPMISPESYTEMVQQIIDYNDSEREKEEAEAAKHIEAIRIIAERSCQRSAVAQELIDVLQFEVQRSKRDLILAESRKVQFGALSALLPYLVDPTYPRTSSIYLNHYGGSDDGEK